MFFFIPPLLPATSKKCSPTSSRLTRPTLTRPSPTQDDEDEDSDSAQNGGWTHKREVVVERPKTPVVQYAVSRYGGEPMGGIQGLWWYARAMFADADGDVANQFMDERDVGREDADDQDDASRGDATERSGKRGMERRKARALVEVAGVRRGDVRLKPASELD